MLRLVRLRFDLQEELREMVQIVQRCGIHNQTGIQIGNRESSRDIEPESSSASPSLLFCCLEYHLRMSARFGHRVRPRD